MLAQLCQRCHNSQLDGTLSRSQFNVEALDRLSARELSLAIERLGLPASDLRRMPPLTTATLSAAEIAALEAALSGR
jgi:cytochrome c553